MGKLYITLADGKIQSCYSDIPIDVAIIDLDAYLADVGGQIAENVGVVNEEMLGRLDAGELLDVTPDDTTSFHEEKKYV